jgi:hypothetical protein
LPGAALAFALAFAAAFIAMGHLAESPTDTPLIVLADSRAIPDTEP